MRLSFIKYPIKLISILFLLFHPALYAIEPMVFQSQVEETRFQHLTHTLRCTVCQNQTLADSDAPLAKDLRQRILEMLQQGHSDDEIKQFLVDRYGDFVLYQPPIKTATYLLWFGPLMLFILGIIIVWLIIKKQQRILRNSQNLD